MSSDWYLDPCILLTRCCRCCVFHVAPHHTHRDSLGALAGAIKEFGGGVVIISHHNEFTTALCPEKWTVGDGKCVMTGAPQVLTREKVEFKVQEEVTDAFGNTIKVRQCARGVSEQHGVSMCRGQQQLRWGVEQHGYSSRVQQRAGRQRRPSPRSKLTRRTLLHLSLLHSTLTPSCTRHPSLTLTTQVKGPKKELSRKEKKAKAKERAARKARGEEVSESEDEL